MTAPEPLRIGLVVPDARVDGHVAALLAALVAHGGVRLVLMATPGRDVADAAPASPLVAAVGAMMLRAETTLLKLVGRRMRSLGARSAALHAGRVDAGKAFEHRLQLPADRVRLPAVDLVIACGGWLPSPAELDTGSAEWIVIEVGEHAGDAGGLMEVMERRDATPVRLRRLDAARADGACVLACANRTRPSWALNRAAAWGRATSLLLAYLADRPGASTRPADAPEPGRPGQPPATLGMLLRYPVRLLIEALGRARRSRARCGVWRLAEVRAASAGAAPFAVPPGAPNLLPEPPAGIWHADPMLFRRAGTETMHCFVEEWDDAAGRAHIAVLARVGGHWTRLGVALIEPFHLSFPFVFEHAGEVYMVPETAAAGDVRLYRSRAFPFGWERVGTLLDGVSATDTMLFERDGRWWMLTNLDRSPQPDHQSELHVFWADSPTSRHWTPVPGNPVRTGCMGARNGGLVQHGGRVYRLGQVQSFERYGARLDVHEITRLDEHGYQEARVSSLAPPGDMLGLHTLARDGDLTVVDLLVPAVAPDRAPVRRAPLQIETSP